MRSNVVTIFLIILVAVAFYFLGKKNGKSETKISVTENVAVIKLIAEMSALDVSGNIGLKISNKGEEEGGWDRFKNYLAENTLQVSIPFTAKFGVDMKDQKMNIDTKSGTATVYLPHCKLLSLQLKMDAMETMSQTGIFTHASMDDLVKAQKKLYAEALKKTEGNPGYIKLAENHISTIMNSYYAPLGYKVKCVFGGNAPAPLQ